MTTKQQQRENSKWVTYDLQKITNPMKKIKLHVVQNLKGTIMLHLKNENKIISKYIMLRTLTNYYQVMFKQQ